MAYNPKRIEKKWQRIWEKTGIDKTPDRIKGKKNFYCLDMFIYPSGQGLHVGHLHGYIGSDIVSRFLRMRGFNVLHPMGFDAFGLPAENAAIKHKIHPKVWTQRNIKNIRKQLKSIGISYDWTREIITCDPDYYKWTQWMFLQFYKKGLVLRAEVPANFCPSCKTVLANEQVIEGKCERCDSEVLQKEIEQWLFKITDYTQDLLKDLEDLDWPARTKLIQQNWIGKSCGMEIKFPLATFTRNRRETKDAKLRERFINVFTTRVDTLFGCTYLVLAPEHQIVENLKPQIKNYKFVKKYIEDSKKKTERERISEVKEKTGIEIKGIKAINPANGREISIFVADYVLMHYGKGAIMAVPAHDQRDFDFAKKYNLAIRQVISPIKADKSADLRRYAEQRGSVYDVSANEKAYKGEGILINSGRFSGMNSVDARERMGEWLKRKGLAKKAVYYKLRDWLISRQRYWGCPIPMIFCQRCGWQLVKEKDLPVLLPRIKDFRPAGEGKSPLDRAKKFVETTCPKCKGSAQRETDTMDTFVCSSWYYLRYSDPQNDKRFATKKKIKTWLPVDLYIGGVEHAVGHLLYSRFFTKVLKDLKYLDFAEPFLKLRHQGIILGPDRQKMSKSKDNVITPESIIKKYGTDTLRLYEMFIGPFSETSVWNVQGIEGCYRFLQRIYKLKSKISPRPFSSAKRAGQGNQKRALNRSGASGLGLERLLNKTIKKVTEDIENHRFNTAISALMILVNEMGKQKEISLVHYSLFLILLSPFAPHLAEELWHQLNPKPYTLNPKYSIHSQPWPKYDPKLIKEETITLIIQVNGKVRDKIEIDAEISKEKARKFAISRKKVQKWIEGKEIKKVVFVPKKLINIVT